MNECYILLTDFFLPRGGIGSGTPRHRSMDRSRLALCQRFPVTRVKRESVPTHARSHTMFILFRTLPRLHNQRYCNLERGATMETRYSRGVCGQVGLLFTSGCVCER